MKNWKYLPDGKGRTLLPLLLGLLGGVLISVIMVGGGAWYLNRKISSGLESYLRKNVFTDSNLANFKRADVHLATGRLILRGLEINRLSDGKHSWRTATNAISFRIPLQELASGNPLIQKLQIRGPSLEIVLNGGSHSADGNVMSTSLTLPSWLKKLPLKIQEFSIKDGSIHLQHVAVGNPLRIGSIGVRFLNSKDQGPPTSVNLEGKVLSEKTGSFFMEAEVKAVGPPSTFEGELGLEEIYIPAIVNLFPTDPEVRVLDGRIDLKTQFTCKEDWLTASHLVKIKNLKVEVGEDKKEIFGIPVKYLKELFNIDELSFVVPVNGSLRDPHIGIQASIHQILLKILEEKFEDKEKARKLARRGAGHFGKKIDKALKEWLNRRRE